MNLTRNHFQHNSSWNAPYTFSGKEKDVETGYNYVKKLRFFSSLAFGNEKQVFHYAHCLRRFGARYFDSGLSVWLSVDPLSDKYPTLSPYTYCANNPIMMVDPDGRFIMIGLLTYTVGMNTTSGFEGKVITALNDLCTGSTIAKEMITYLATSTTYTVNIAETSDYPYQYASDFEEIEGSKFYKKGTSGTIYLNKVGEFVPEQTNKNWYYNVGVINFKFALMHEISHAYHHAFGDLMKKSEMTNYGLSGEIETRDVQATNDENSVRSQMGENLRTNYKRDTKTNTGIGPSLIKVEDNGDIRSSDPGSPNLYYKKRKTRL